MSENVQTQQVNGVDVQRLGETIEAVQADASLAQFKFRAQNDWLDGGNNRTVIRDFYGAGQEDRSRSAEFVYDADEPDVLLGSDKGANPVEYLLHALAACMTTSMVYHAAARGITIESIRSTFEGQLDLHGFLGLDESVRPGYQGIRASFAVKADATAEQLAELFRFSPVFNSIAAPVEIEADVQIV